MPPDRLPAAALARRTDPASLGFATTADLEPLEGIVAQERAAEAVEFAIEMTRPGYNVFALGPEGIGKSTLVRTALERHAVAGPVAEDLVYVHDFDHPQRPRALLLPAGRGATLAEAMERLIVELRAAIPAAFESDEYRTRREAIDESFTEQRDAILAAFEIKAKGAGLALVRTAVGIGLTAARDGEAMSPDEFARLPEADQTAIRSALEGLEDELGAILARIRRSEREKHGQFHDLDRSVAAGAVGHLLTDVREAFAGLPSVLAWLVDVEADIISHAGEFVAASADGGSAVPAALRSALGSDAITFRRYSVNVLVDRRGETGAPVVLEDNPTIANLVGRVEYVSTLGALTTDFTLIRAGALHRANGGYLMIEARKVLSMPFAWEGLKRTLRSGELRIETPAQALGLMPTVTLEPAPVPIATKVALVGDRTLYYLLCALDPEFLELFKVEADFEDELDRSPEILHKLAAIRGAASLAMGIGKSPEEAQKRSVPLVGFVSPAQDSTLLTGENMKGADVDLTGRMISNGQPHRALPITASLCMAVAARIKGTVVNEATRATSDPDAEIRIAMPSGVLTAAAAVRNSNGAWHAEQGAFYRTARRMFEGFVLVRASRVPGLVSASSTRSIRRTA